MLYQCLESRYNAVCWFADTILGMLEDSLQGGICERRVDSSETAYHHAAYALLIACTPTQAEARPKDLWFAHLYT